MIRSLRFVLTLGLLATVLVGCDSSASNEAKSVSETAKPVKELESKMGSMSPEQRAQYIKDHPEEFQNLGTVPTSNPPTVPPTSR